MSDNPRKVVPIEDSTPDDYNASPDPELEDVEEQGVEENGKKEDINDMIHTKSFMDEIREIWDAFMLEGFPLFIFFTEFKFYDDF